MANLVGPNSYISGYAMHNSEGIIICSTYALHTSLLVFAPPLARIYWHGMGTKIMFFTAGEHWSNVPQRLFAAQYSDFTCLWISSSSFSEAFSNTKVFHLVKKLYTYTVHGQAIAHVHCSKNCTRFFPEKHLMEQVLYNFGVKRTPVEH